MERGEAPTDDGQLLEAVREARAQNPEMGVKKLVQLVKKKLPDYEPIGAKEIRAALTTLSTQAVPAAPAETSSAAQPSTPEAKHAPAKQAVKTRAEAYQDCAAFLVRRYGPLAEPKARDLCEALDEFKPASLWLSELQGMPKADLDLMMAPGLQSEHELTGNTAPDWVQPLSSRRDKPQAGSRVCAAAGCELVGLKVCAKCKSVWYCSKSCQSAHRHAHKPICKHIAGGRSKRLSSSELQIEPWTTMTSYSVRDEDYMRFEKHYEREIAAFAEEVYRTEPSDEPGLILVALEKQSLPLDLVWVPLKAANRRGGPTLSTQLVEEILKDHAAGAFHAGTTGQYVVMATWSGTRPNASASFQQWTNYWHDNPVNWHTFGGHGSTMYKGPPGLEAFHAHYFAQHGEQASAGFGRLLEMVTAKARTPIRLK